MEKQLSTKGVHNCPMTAVNRFIFACFYVSLFSLIVNMNSRTLEFGMHDVYLCKYYVTNYFTSLRMLNSQSVKFITISLDPVYTGLVTTLQVLYLLEICCLR